MSERVFWRQGQLCPSCGKELVWGTNGERPIVGCPDGVARHQDCADVDAFLDRSKARLITLKKHQPPAPKGP